MTMTEDDSERTRRSIVRAIAAGGAAAILGSGTAAAQSTEEATPTATPTETEEGERVVLEIDSATRLTNWEFEGGAFVLEFEAEIPSSIAITDSGAMMKAWEGSGSSGGGATSIPMEPFSLSSGKSTVEFDATEFEGAAAISVSTADGLVFIYSESIDRSAVSVELSTAMAGGAAAAVGSGALSYRQTKEALEDEDEPNAERIV